MIGISHEDGSVDYLHIGIWSGAREQALWRWGQANLPTVDDGGPFGDLHRLQLEHWLDAHKERLQGRVMDVGQPWRRHWAGDGYFTLGPGCEVEGDITDLCVDSGSLDAVVCAEVLEHCSDPFAAMRELWRVLKPGGLLLVTSPFLWPDHHTIGPEGYPDFWRFTRQGWELLLRDFQAVNITRCEWSAEGAAIYDMLRRTEGFGFRGHTEGATGYLAEGVK